MDEHVLAAFLPLDETKSLGIIEPFHSTGWQTLSPPFTKLEFPDATRPGHNGFWSYRNLAGWNLLISRSTEQKKPTKSQAKFSWIERLKPTKNLLQLSYYLLLPVTSYVLIHSFPDFVKQNLQKSAKNLGFSGSPPDPVQIQLRGPF
jgi:hypothetical protein